MPPLPRLRIGALEDLAGQLRFAPRAALDRHIASAERLAREIEADQLYPEDWFVFRLTGYRAEIETPASFVGAALLGDLSALVERLSLAAGHSAEDAGPDALEIPVLCERWNVSRKTVERYRRRGLIARRVTKGKTQRLVFPLANVETFERRERERVDRASAFSRIDDALSDRMYARAARYRSSRGYSLNEAAARLAQRFDRSHEGVRQVLRRADERAEAEGRSPVFTEPPPPDRRERRVVHRALRRGIEPIELARRYGRARVSIVRSLNLARLEAMLGLDLGGPVLATFEREEAEEVLLSNEAVRTGLGVGAPDGLIELVERSRERRASPAREEQLRLIAYHFLRWRVAQDLARTDRASPSGEMIDTCETRLRWAGRLKAKLVESELHLVLASFDRSGLDTRSMGSVDLSRALLAGIRAVGDAIDRFDPSRGSRLAAASGMALARVTGAWSHPAGDASSGRATPRLARGTPAPDWAGCVSPWQRWLEPDRRIPGTLDRLEERDRLVLERRFGLDGKAPETLAALGDRLGTTRVHAARFERAAIRHALAAARSLA
ncbi:MAG: sigma factor-like helix-turn-helix DNA-binding protein [Phycisphaerales bacterium JB059]